MRTTSPRSFGERLSLSARRRRWSFVHGGSRLFRRCYRPRAGLAQDQVVDDRELGSRRDTDLQDACGREDSTVGSSYRPGAVDTDARSGELASPPLLIRQSRWEVSQLKGMASEAFEIELLGPRGNAARVPNRPTSPIANAPFV